MTPGGSGTAGKEGRRAATPLLLLLALGFAVPLIAVTAFTFGQPRCPNNEVKSVSNKTSHTIAVGQATMS